MADSQLPKVTLPTSGIPLSFLVPFLSLAMSAIVGYGTAKQATGQNLGEVQELQRLAASNKAEIDYLRGTTASKDQMELMLQMVKDIRSDQSEIKREVSEIRRGR